MVANKSIPMTEVAELNRLQQETESYQEELKLWNEEIYEMCHQKNFLE